MHREIKALAVAVGVSAACLAGMSGFAQVLRNKARAISHAQPAEESWQLWKPVAAPEAIATGGKLFLNSCAHCHGADARGDEGPDLHDLQMSDRHIVNVIKKGIKGEMPSFAKKHTDAEIAELLAYVRSLKNDPSPGDDQSTPQ
jgi:mono/diheme cytochrome c family protein